LRYCYAVPYSSVSLEQLGYRLASSKLKQSRLVYGQHKKEPIHPFLPSFIHSTMAYVGWKVLMWINRRRILDAIHHGATELLNALPIGHMWTEDREHWREFSCWSTALANHCFVPVCVYVASRERSREAGREKETVYYIATKLAGCQIGHQTGHLYTLIINYRKNMKSYRHTDPRLSSLYINPNFASEDYLGRDVQIIIIWPFDLRVKFFFSLSINDKGHIQPHTCQ